MILAISGRSILYAYSGDTEPSQEDVAITKRLVEAGELLGIKIHDHVIVSKNGYTSMKERGVI